VAARRGNAGDDLVRRTPARRHVGRDALGRGRDDREPVRDPALVQRLDGVVGVEREVGDGGLVGGHAGSGYRISTNRSIEF
jgi:hypothetical protein